MMLVMVSVIHIITNTGRISRTHAEHYCCGNALWTSTSTSNISKILTNILDNKNLQCSNSKTVSIESVCVVIVIVILFCRSIKLNK